MKGLVCVRCDAEMARARVRRLGGCLGVLGTICLWGGPIVALGGCLLIWSGFEAAESAREAIDKSAYESALAEIQTVEGAPGPLVAEFREHKRIDDATLRDIPESSRLRIRGILERYDRRGGPTGCAPLHGLGGALLAVAGTVVLISGLVGVMFGFLLTLKKSVWRCSSCGELS